MKTMSEDRQLYLVKAAEETIGLMNCGIAPNAALRKVAEEKGLKPAEVKLVSDSINNSKTLSVLANSKAEDKGKPFTLTNAEDVNNELWSKNPDAMGEEPKEEEGNFDPSKVKAKKLDKKAASQDSLTDTGSYLDDKEDHAAIFREACGFDTVVHRRAKLAVDTTDDCEVILRAETEVTGHAKLAGADVHARVVETDPWAKLAGAQHQSDEARLMYMAAHDEACNGFDELVYDFRRTDAPTFARVEKIARELGVSDELIDLVFTDGGLERFGHVRDDGKVKLANDFNLASCSPSEVAYARKLAKIAAYMTEASNAYAVHTLLEEGLVKAAAGISEGVQHMATEAQNMPGKILGSDADNESAVDLIGGATDTLGEKPIVEPGDKSPLDVGTRQELANNDTRIAVEKLMSDKFVGAHPLHHVIDAFNRIRSVNPNLSSAELQNLVRQDLASGGDVSFDTLHRARKSNGHQA